MSSTPVDFRPMPPHALTTVTWYELLEEVGRGRMGVVYRARHVGLNKIVAVKVMRDALFAGRRERTRFRNEAEAVAGLQHAHIVQVHDYGEHDDVPFFCMEFLEGGTLTRRLRRGRMTVAAAAELIEILARAIHHAHDHGIIHRDLKPGNILFTADGTPKIADFSIAKLLNGRGDETETGAILGTACYMAPEQAWGRSRRVTPAADTYSLGAILYQALTGQPPFRGSTFLQTLARVRDADPVPPSLRQPDVPEELEAICLKCLRKGPARRFCTALALAEELHRFRNSV
jgi:eukaryotic-like serine/threonine-protein kinase